MAKQLKLAVIAEGVETEEQVEFLASNGCIDFQGYFFSRPLSVQNFTAYLAGNMDPQQVCCNGDVPGLCCAPSGTVVVFS
jgi:sensor c-di-GMP phosphodiesterase-like protein